MRLKRRHFLQAACVLVLGVSAVWGQTPAVPTRGGNNLRSGLYQDSILTPQAVAQRGLRVYFNLGMEGDARGSESQPLIDPSVVMASGETHPVLVVSSLNNNVWAYDPINSKILWVQDAGSAVKSNNSVDYWNINDHVGFLSTGTIDTETHIWYGVAVVSPDQVPQHGKHFIYGLSLKDGSFAFSPVPMPDEYDSVMRKQRVSLGLATFGGKKTVFFGSGTVLETSSTSAGYLCAFDIDSRKVTLFALAQQGGGAGIWQAGSGLILDEAKQAIFGVTGNGTFDPAKGDWSETVFRASYTPPTATSNGHFKIEDWWTPYSDQWRAANAPAAGAEKLPRLAGHSLSTAKNVDGHEIDAGQPVNGMHMKAARGMAMGDEDFGSAPCNYVPQFDELLCAGKDSIGMMVRASDMGKTQPQDLVGDFAPNYAKLWIPPFWYGTFPGWGVKADPNDAATLNQNVMLNGKTTHVHSASVIDNQTNYIFVGAENSNVRAWQLNPDHSITYLANSDDVASPDLANVQGGGMTGTFMCATTGGILVALMPRGDANRTVTDGIIIIYDSRNFETRPDGSKRLKVLWRSDQPGHGQQPITFKFPKFDVPVVWDGKIYLPTFDGRIGTLVLGLN